ncbi:DivIVA domain-containing protein [Streptococcus tangpeifui]|uniref:Septum site-determining protein divIVA family protein n=1 Tax=Streptococcus criceti HS-6 TaxID=873449 RepID=G5JSJ9_STRCG|nr:MULTISPECIES: DivIVA domain-containing protein [Streptococcus]EHI73783.1 septum site-determining protein divIVA family protein [Streptococcus criceti HS-6]SUN42737.1 cell-division protein DivIVA [Streptococcus criceti]
MALTALDIKDKTFHTKFRGYNEREVDAFLDDLVDDFEDLTRKNRDLEAKIKNLEEKLVYFDEMKESLSQSVILAQETAEKVKFSANTQATNLLSKANYDANQLIDEAKTRANKILRDATDEAKAVAIETEALKRQSRVFHQRLLSTIEGQLNMINSQEWSELLQPTAVYLQNSDEAFKEVVEKVLDDNQTLTSAGTTTPIAESESTDDATRQFTESEMAELQRRVEESNRILEETQKLDLGEISAAIDAADNTPQAKQAPTIQDTSEMSATELAGGEAQTFKLNIQD